MPLPHALLLTLAQSSTDAAPLPGKSLLDYIHDGGFLSYILVILSIVALALVIRNIIALRASRLAPPEIVERLESLFRAGDLAGAAALCADPAHSSFLTRILNSSLVRCAQSPLGFLELRPAMEEAGQKEVDRLHRLNDGIGILAAVGPMLGLLGTVIGMIGAFGAISALQGAARSSELARFMSIALVNTAEGLIVAIPCTIAFALFRRRIDRLANEAGETAERLAALAERAADSASVNTTAAPAPTALAAHDRAPARPAAPRPIAESARASGAGAP